MKFLPILAAVLLSGTVVSAQTKQPASANASAKAKAATAKAKPAQAAASANGALKWDKTMHQFGDIKQGTPVTASFKYTNTSKKPVLLTNAQGSCGCTVPNWSKEPLLPGKSQVITATFNAAAAGPFNKTVTVTTNADDPTKGAQVLTLQGTVLAGATADATKK